MKKFDEDGNGQISLQEFTELHAFLRQQQEEAAEEASGAGTSEGHDV